MSRSFKFRYFNKENNTLMTFGGMPMLVEDLEFIDENNRLVVTQYTGVDDISGFEIYEGDILEYYRNEITEIRPVVYSIDCFVVRDANGNALPVSSVNATASIIGNIFKNPELLNTNEYKEQVFIKAMREASEVLGADPAYFGDEGKEEVERQLEKLGYSLEELRETNE